MSVGTLAWADRTRGRLRSRDRLVLEAQRIVTVVDYMTTRLRDRLGLPSSRAVRADVERMTPPNSDAARAAEALCVEASTTAVANHSFRTYLWARLLALRDDVSPDDEVLYIASVLHDLGFTERFWDRDDAECFSLDGADAGAELLRTHGWADGRVDAVREAVLLHLNVRVPRRHGDEARLLAAATVLDVTGFGLRKIERATAADVTRRHPRNGMGIEFAEWIRRESRHRPASRMAYLDEKLALGRRVQREWR